MGFDIECILNIQSLPGEYFCPVCRTLVYPNEALQTQCTHLYCKPCLTYIVNTNPACPYDGYLVTEVDAKPLIESDKVLAENIGKVRVHCLYHRSGCTWQGPFSECTSHCSVCSFGNSPVVCNRCGIQIVHRQVQEHAQSCPGANPQAPQAAESVQDAATSVTTAIAADQGQTATQAVTSTSQGTTSQTAAPPPLVQASSQLNTNPQAQAVSTAPVATPDQWYQQQYQQYYQQYPGYDPYQQSYQQYYPYQQQAVQQYQQHQPQQHPTQVQGQPQPQVYPQPQPQAQGHPPAMAPALAQAPPPPPPQPQPQPQPQMQGFPLTQPQPQVQSQPQLQIPPHGQTQPHPHVQAPVAPQHQNQPQVNPQHQLHPMVQPNAQVQSQPLLPPHSHPPSHPQPYPNAQPHPQVQPLPQPHMPVPPYQQSHLQMHNVQPHSQPQTQPQPLPPQPQPQPQPQFQPQPQPQPHVQVQLQAQPQHPSHPRPPQYPSHPNQQQIPNAPPQTQHQSAHAATGYHAYSQTQAHQQMQLANPQQHPVHTHPLGGPLPPAPMHGQFPPPPPHVRPPQSNAPLPNQQPTMMPLQGQVPPVQHQQIYPHPQQQSQPIQQRPVMQSNQQHQQYMQQHQPFAGQAAGPAQSQLNQHGNFAQQQPMQSQSRSQGPSQLMQQSPHAYPQTQQNVAVAHGMQPQQSQNYTGRQMMPHTPQSQPLPQSAGARGVVAQVRPVQHGLNQSVNQIYENRFNNQMQMSAEPERQEDHISGKSMSARSPSQKNAEKDVNGVGADPAEVKALKPEIDPINEEKSLVEQKDNIKPGEVLIEGTVPDVQAGKDVSGELASLQKAKEEGVDSTLAPTSQVAGYAVSEEKVASSEVGLSQPDDFSSRQAETNEEQRGKFPKDLADSGMKVFSGLDKGLTANVAYVPTSDPGRRQQPPMHYGPPMHNQRSPASSMLHPLPPPGPHPNATLLRPEGPGSLPLSGQAINQGEHFQSPVPMQNHGSNHLDMPVGGYRGAGSMDPLGRGSSHFGPPNRSYGPLSGPPLGPPPAGSMDPPGGIMGRGPPHGPEGLQTAKVETELFRDQRPHHFEGRQLEPHLPGSMDRGSFGHASGIGANAMTVNGAPLMNSSSAPGLRDERFKPFAEERLDPFPVDHSRRQAPRPFDNAPSGFNYDAGGAPSRFLPPYHSAGNFLPNDAGERGLPVGPHDDERGRGGSAHMRPPFPGPVPGFAQHGMERLNPQSPGREFVGIASRGSGAGPGVSRGQFGFNDNDGREPHLFEGSRSFGPPSDSAGMSFNENRFPIFPGHSRRGEFDGGLGNRMGEHVGSGPLTHLRGGDPMGQDNLPSHLHRGEMMGPRNLRGHLHFGEGTEVGAFPGNTRMGDMAGPGNFPPRPPFGEPFGGNNGNRPRLGEPGFRSSYSLPGFQNDGGFYAGGTDSFDRSRKRKPISMGWCRICRVDCESVEGLDLHAQTREHQKMAMDMVISIKKQNAKKLKPANDHTTVEEASKSRIAGFEARINKP